MEPTNFDDFIKSNTENDLPVPTELNWENMNFTLPPAKRKRRILPWMLFFLLGALGIGSGLWDVYHHDSTQSQSLSKNDSIGVQNQNNKIILKKDDAFANAAHPQDDRDNTVTRINVTRQENFKTEQLAKADKAHPRDAAENTDNRNNVANQENFKTEQLAKADKVHPRDAAENTVSRNNVTNQENFKTQRLSKADITDPRDTEENTVTPNNIANQENFKAERLARIETEEDKPLSLSKNAKSIDIEYTKAETLHQTQPSQPDSMEKTNQNRLKLPEPHALLNTQPFKPISATSAENHLTVSPHAQAESRTKHVRKSVSLLLSIGTNKAQMNHNSARLNDALAPAWGNSFQILLEHELKNNWLFSIGFGYQRLHTTFYFEKDLGTSVNSQLQIIKKTRQVFHNNYFDHLSLNLGAGKQFKLSQRLNGQLLMYLSPTRRLSYTGKSLDDSESVVAFDPNSGVLKEWLLNADAAFRFSYKLNKTDLIIGVNLSQSLTKSDLQSVGNSTTTIQPRVFGLNLGIKRTLSIRKK